MQLQNFISQSDFSKNFRVSFLKKTLNSYFRVPTP